MNTTWHADPAVLARYVADDLDDVNASSLEAHVLMCAHCREALASLVPPSPLDTMWHGIEIVLDAPQPGFVERALLRLGVHDHVARLLAATPSLRMSWLLAEALALGSAAFAAQNAVGTNASGGALFLFLVLAALAPVAGVAVAFGPGVDPAYEIGVASPMRTDRLVFIRATAVLIASIVIAFIASIALPGLDRTMTLWLLPALGLTLATLAIATWLHPVVAACVVGLGWVAFAAVVSVANADPLAPFHLEGQVLSVVAIVSCLLVLAQRHTVYEGGLPS
ncbi:MAG TPA: zf-HC2 domain-containing protein [Actinomycetota bacterium]